LTASGEEAHQEEDGEDKLDFHYTTFKTNNYWAGPKRSTPLP